MTKQSLIELLKEAFIAGNDYAMYSIGKESWLKPEPDFNAWLSLSKTLPETYSVEELEIMKDLIQWSIPSFANARESEVFKKWKTEIELAISETKKEN